MNPEHSNVDYRENPETGLTIEYSPVHDIDVVHKTVNELSWLKEQGYNPRIPEKIEDILGEGKLPTQDEIAEAVAAEFQLEAYTKLSGEVMAEWMARREDILAKLSTLGFPIQSGYVLRLTTYGVGGEYHLPNVIDANIHKADTKDILVTIVHEAIHLTIKNAIDENDIGHWPTERIVDLIFGRFYPERAELQKDPGQAHQIGEIFDRSYPDLQRVILEIGKLRQERP